MSARNVAIWLAGCFSVVLLLGTVAYVVRPLRIVRIENGSSKTVESVQVRTAIGNRTFRALAAGEFRVVAFRGFGEGAYYLTVKEEKGAGAQFSCGYYSVTTPNSFLDVVVGTDETDRPRCRESFLDSP